MSFWLVCWLACFLWQLGWQAQGARRLRAPHAPAASLSCERSAAASGAQPPASAATMAGRHVGQARQDPHRLAQPLPACVGRFLCSATLCQPACQPNTSVGQAYLEREPPPPTAHATAPSSAGTAHPRLPLRRRRHCCARCAAQPAAAGAAPGTARRRQLLCEQWVAQWRCICMRQCRLNALKAC